MRAFWRGDKPLCSHAEWRGKLGKNSKQGTSAPTLAAVWGGPVELMGALRNQPEFEGLRLTQLVVEAQSSVDEFSGRRDHDLVARGELPTGECVVICVEAKAGESFGAAVKHQAAAAARAKLAAEKDSRTSNAPERLQGLLARFVNYPTSEPRVQTMRYQLLTALAGTLSEAEECGAAHAVLMVHEFLTDQRPDAEIVRDHDRELHNLRPLSSVSSLHRRGRRRGASMSPACRGAATGSSTSLERSPTFAPRRSNRCRGLSEIRNAGVRLQQS
jgi:hypothetical protein